MRGLRRAVWAGAALVGGGVVMSKASEGGREVPRGPVVLCHGFAGWRGSEGLAYFRGVQEHLEDKGVIVMATKVPPFASIHARASLLALQVEEFVGELRKEFGPEVRVNLVAHSMAGLDARAACHLLSHQEIASITTISTPHRGSELALVLPGISFLSDLLGVDVGAYGDLSPASMLSFDSQYPDVPHVQYFCVAGAQRVSPAHPLFLPQQLLRQAVGAINKQKENLPYDPQEDLKDENDGMVTVRSAIAHGRLLGIFYNLNHFSEIGWLSDGQQHLYMYDHILRQLAAKNL